MASIINATTTGGLVTSADNSGILELQSGGVTIATISSTGLQQNVGAPAFSAYMIGTYQTVSANTYTKVALDGKLFDTNSNYNTSTYRWTPTVAGYYQINAALGVSYLTTVMNGFIVLIYKNGSAYLSTQSRINSLYGTGYINQLVYMNGSTDYLELWGYSVGGTDPVFQGSQGSPVQYNSWFSGVLVRAA